MTLAEIRAAGRAAAALAPQLTGPQVEAAARVLASIEPPRRDLDPHAAGPTPDAALPPGAASGHHRERDSE